MSRFSAALYNAGKLERLARQDTCAHRIDPRANLCATLLFVITGSSFSPYALLPLLFMAVYPLALILAGRVCPAWIWTRIIYALPFIVLIGLFNPYFDRQIVHTIAGVNIYAGWLSFASILARGLLCISAALAMIATTGLDNLCLGLERLKVPQVLCTQIMLLYRYMFLLMHEGLRMARARELRACGSRPGLKNGAALLGNLLTRALNRAERCRQAMLCRSYSGRLHTMHELYFTASDFRFLAGWSAYFALVRFMPLGAA
jgi:cobalt/nickel transport system permease protein